MIKVTIRRDSQGRVQSFQVSGHAGFARAGEDIVCAAVSILTQNTVNSIETLLHVKIPGVSEEGFLKCEIPPLEGLLSDQVQLLLESMVYGLSSLSEEYPKYVRMVDHDTF
jgi:uncharacterized protein YsxB (DUF464 family)